MAGFCEADGCRLPEHASGLCQGIPGDRSGARACPPIPSRTSPAGTSSTAAGAAPLDGADVPAKEVGRRWVAAPRHRGEEQADSSGHHPPDAVAEQGAHASIQSRMGSGAGWRCGGRRRPRPRHQPAVQPPVHARGGRHRAQDRVDPTPGTGHSVGRARDVAVHRFHVGSNFTERASGATSREGGPLGASPRPRR